MIFNDNSWIRKTKQKRWQITSISSRAKTKNSSVTAPPWSTRTKRLKMFINIITQNILLIVSFIDFFFTLLMKLWLLYSWKTSLKKNSLSTFSHYKNKNVNKDINQRTTKNLPPIRVKMFYYIRQRRNRSIFLTSLKMKLENLWNI